MWNAAPISQATGPLSDLRILELGTLIAGPFAGRWFADFGADVIKIEYPGSGDPLRRWGKSADGGDSLWHLVQSRGKRSVTADLHDPDDQAFVRRLALESDILIENFRPGRLERWNLDPASLIEANPRLIVVRISGYGQTGPLREQPGFGTIAEAAGGLRYITGEPGDPPTRVGLSLGDSIASMHALVGALIALARTGAVRPRPDRRCRLDRVPLHDARGRPPRVRLRRHDPPADRQHRPQLGTHEHVPVRRRRARLHRGQHDPPFPDALPDDRPRGRCQRPGPRHQQGPGAARGRTG